MTYLLRELPISAKEYAFGRSKIFIRSVSVLDQVSCDWSEPGHVTTVLTSDWSSWRSGGGTAWRSSSPSSRRSTAAGGRGRAGARWAVIGRTRCHVTLLTPLIGPAAGVPDRDLHLLEAVEGQVPHHRAQAAPQAGVGRRHPAEALPVQLQPDIFQFLVKYFCTDSETTARRWQLARWLTALAHSLPSESPLCRDWPRAPPGTNMKETSFLLRKLYHKWRVGQQQQQQYNNNNATIVQSIFKSFCFSAKDFERGLTKQPGIE